ncbi:MAG: response regulator transcription factor [Gemmatimonadales bacterium]|nr:response regulator transcription factor [Gemmatimonadales bacterium]
MSGARLLIADDHPLVREGIRARLEAHPGWTVCAEASNGREAVARALEHRPDVAVLDIGMPELNGLSAAQQIRKGSPGTEILILTMLESDDLAREALAAGARGFLLKTDAVRLLVAAVESLLQHQPYFTGAVSQMVLQGFLDPRHPDAPRSNTPRTNTPRLTSREREVVQLLAEGMTTKEAAARLGLSTKTVESHRANLMRKLDLHSVADLVRFAVRHHIVEP